MRNTPIQVHGLLLKNRLVMPPMASSKSAPDDGVSPELCAYYDEKTRGGCIGLVITEHSYINRTGKAHDKQLSIARDGDIPGLAQLVSVIHGNGSKVFAQINHAGSGTQSAVTGGELLGASPVLPSPQSELELPREMTQEEIDAVVRDFASAALRAKRAGFDGVEIHSAHGYLLNQFYSPLTNKRTDRYTGTALAGRIQLHLEVIAAVRAAVGDDYPIALRLGACDYTEGGSTAEDGAEACAAFERAGVDLLDISGGMCGYIRPGAAEQGYFAELSELIRRRVSIPVILTGGITDRDAMEALLEAGKADLIGVGRAILKNSSWAVEAMRE